MLSEPTNEKIRRDLYTGFVLHRLGVFIQSNHPRYKDGISASFIGHAGARLIEDWFFLEKHKNYKLTDIWYGRIPYRYGSLTALRPGGLLPLSGYEKNLAERYFYPDLVKAHPLIKRFGAGLAGEGDQRKLLFPPVSFPMLRDFYREYRFDATQLDLVDQLSRAYCSLSGDAVTIIATCISKEHTQEAVDTEINIWHKDYENLLEILDKPATEESLAQTKNIANSAFDCTTQIGFKIDMFERLAEIQEQIGNIQSSPVAQEIRDNLYPESSLSSELARRKEVGHMLVSFMYQTFRVLEAIGIRDMIGEKQNRYRDKATRIYLVPNIAKKEVDKIFEIAKNEKDLKLFKDTRNRLYSLYYNLCEWLKDQQLISRFNASYWEQFTQ